MTVAKVKLGEAADILSGYAFKSELFSDSEGMPLIRIRDVVRGFTETRYSGEFGDEFVVQNGEIVIGMDGNFNAAKWGGGRALLNQRVCKIKARESVLNENYLFHYLPNALKKIEDATPFVTVKHLSVKGIREIEIPIPPLPEQHSIAAILDQADALRVKRREALAQLDSLTQSIFIEMFGDPVTNPKGIQQKPLGDLLKLKSGNFLPATDMVSGGTYPVFGGNGINGYHDQFMFSEPQIIIGRVGVYCGCVHISPPTSWVTDNALYVSERNPQLNFEYLAYSLKQAKLNQYASQSAQPLISGARLYPVKILVPSLELQCEFTRRIAAVEKLRSSHHTYLSEFDTLFASLQHRAFRGEL